MEQTERSELSIELGSVALHDLRAVAAVAAARHFGRAAAGLGIAQPTLTARVQKVERVLGVALFERGAGPFVVTAEGERVLPRVREVVEAGVRMAAAARPAAGRSPLRVGVIPTLGPYLVPHLLLPAPGRGVAPQFTITEAPTAALLEMLRAGELDAALLSTPSGDEPVEFIPLFDEPFLLVARRGSDLLGNGSLSPSRLRACDMVLLEDGHCLRHQALAVCGRRGGSIPRLVATSLETLKYLVAAGEGYSLLPRLACGLSPPLAALLEVRAFDERPPARRIGLCFRRTYRDRVDLEELAGHVRRCLPAGVTPVAKPGRTGGKRRGADACERPG